MDITRIVLVGKDLDKPGSKPCIALISIYEPPVILCALKHRFYHQPDLGTIHLPEINITLFVPSKQCFRIPRVLLRLFSQCTSSGYILPAQSLNGRFELLGHSVNEFVRVHLRLGRVDAAWAFAEPQHQDVRAQYLTVMSEALRNIFPTTLEPAPILKQPVVPRFPPFDTCRTPSNMLPEIAGKAAEIAHSERSCPCRRPKVP